MRDSVSLVAVGNDPGDSYMSLLAQYSSGCANIVLPCKAYVLVITLYQMRCRTTSSHPTVRIVARHLPYRCIFTSTLWVYRETIIIFVGSPVEAVIFYCIIPEYWQFMSVASSDLPHDIS